MSNEGKYAVILVESISRVMLIEKLLQGAGIACRLIPVPRHLSSDCGSCVRLARADVPTAREILAAASVTAEAICDI